MPIPTHIDAMLPVLQALADGKARQRLAMTELMADHFQLSAAEREVLLPSGRATVIRSRVGWALTYLKQAALVDSPRRGLYAITNRGTQVLAQKPSRIDSDFLAQFEDFRNFRSRSRVEAIDETIADSTVHVSATLSLPPDEALEEAYGRLRTEIEAELLSTVKQVQPAFFEQLVIDLLVRMGYGGSREEAARAVGRSGDGGIDGVIDEDRLGLDVIYVQAKRWESSVGRPEIQKFAGALQGQRAKKGVFITTSTFTREAEEYAQKIDSRIVLIDGGRLVGLMFEFDIGVSPKGSYTVKSIDGDYFEDS